MNKTSSKHSASVDASVPVSLPSKHLLGIEGMSPLLIRALLDRGDMFANNPQSDISAALKGKTIVNLFYENSTRTRVSFELAAKRLGGSVLNISVAGSSVKKGETLLDTATTLNAMHPDILVVRHNCAGAAKLLSQHVDAAVINAGDGRHEHPTQALLDALTIRRRIGRIEGLRIAICGDIANSRVARSNIHLLGTLGAEIRLVCPSTLLPAAIDQMGVSVFTDLETGIRDADIVMMLRLQTERMAGTETPSQREYFNFFGLDKAKLERSAPDALIMHPGPMNRGVEIDSTTADDVEKSLIRTQVEMGVAARMACLEAVALGLDNAS
ncbi:aspartate carbamoyltransferase catalytic subunit [Candidatus Puniceispirillum sp.]|uniref:aspartate carbamoyltransferase catalytic subunit n=1 Tax=Candidatus Puniceispirillum sp. TaxID=2026719 RepID=UPI003F69DA6D